MLVCQFGWRLFTPCFPKSRQNKQAKKKTCGERCGQHTEVEGSQSGSLLIEMIRALQRCTDWEKISEGQEGKQNRLGFLIFFTSQSKLQAFILTLPHVEGHMNKRRRIIEAYASGEKSAWDWSGASVQQLGCSVKHTHLQTDYAEGLYKHTFVIHNWGIVK